MKFIASGTRRVGALVPLAPIALLPENVGHAVLVVVSLLSFGWTVHWLGGQAAGPGGISDFPTCPPLSVECQH